MALTPEDHWRIPWEKHTKNLKSRGYLEIELKSRGTLTPLDGLFLGGSLLGWMDLKEASEEVCTVKFLQFFALFKFGIPPHILRFCSAFLTHTQAIFAHFFAFFYIFLFQQFFLRKMCNFPLLQQRFFLSNLEFADGFRIS